MSCRSRYTAERTTRHAAAGRQRNHSGSGSPLPLFLLRGGQPSLSWDACLCMCVQPFLSSPPQIQAYNPAGICFLQFLRKQNNPCSILSWAQVCKQSELLLLPPCPLPRGAPVPSIPPRLSQNCPDALACLVFQLFLCSSCLCLNPFGVSLTRKLPLLSHLPLNSLLLSS